MRRSVLVVVLTLLVCSFYLSCGGGGDSDGSSVANLQGTWFGVIEDDTGALQEFSQQVDGAGNVVEEKVGDVVTGITGFINEDWDENLFWVLLNNPGGSSPLQGGIMIVDNGYRHATYADSGLLFGVIEKGAVSLPAYASSDIVGDYTGGAYEFAFDPEDNFWTWGGDPVSMTVNANLIFSGAAPGESFSGGFDPTLRSSTSGGYIGTVDSSRPMKLDIKALVSPDRTFVAAYAKEAGTIPVSYDEFILMGLLK